MITPFYILLGFGLLSIVLHRTALLKPFALTAFGIAGSVSFMTASADLKLFEIIVSSVLFAFILHEQEDITITQTLFLGASSMLLLESDSILSFVIAFESLSLISVILVSYVKTKDEVEGAVKMFIASALATGFLFLGLTFYLMGGGELQEVLHPNATLFEMIGVFIMLLALFYKLTLVPFHGWAVDTYAKVSHTNAALLSGVAKTVAVVAVFKIFEPFLALHLSFAQPLFIIVALLTMTFGNFLALFRKNIAEILAYSSVAHAGYMALAFVAVSSSYAQDGILYMAIAYIFMQSAAFLILDTLKKSYAIVSLDDLHGFAQQNPLLGALLSIQLFSLAGIPLLAGFLAKAVIFYAVVDSGLWWVALIALLNSALSVAYYAIIVKSIYFEDLKVKKLSLSNRTTAFTAQLILVAGTIFFGIFAGVIL